MFYCFFRGRDFLVIEDAKVVGRIYEDRYVPADVKWSITEYMQFGMQTNNPSHSRLASGLIQGKSRRGASRRRLLLQELYEHR